MTSRQFDAVLFDLDGTLIDSIPGILDSFDHVRQQFGQLTSVTNNQLISHIGRPFIDFMMEMVGSRTLAQEIMERYQVHNRAKIPSMPLYPGAFETLSALRQASIKTGIVTSKNRHSTMLSVQAHSLGELLDVVVAKDDTEIHKPNPIPILFALQKIDVSPSRSIYVGDTEYDMIAARAAGCKSIGAKWGALSFDKLVASNPDWIVEEMRDVLAIALKR